jgi:AAA+ superfamily predicted ATPase
MTAESVAEHTKRPLYMVTSGELGSDPSAMEEELTRVLDLAKTWNSVVLLDEADVFLEQRSVHDLVRNSLVSIFLRHLEYFKSIMFLTTNRVSTFDEAFESRIHVSLRYRDLSADAREQVWRNFAAMVTKDGKDNVHLEESDFAELKQEKLNGRQIKNCFRTAQALAADKRDRVGVKHIRVVLDAMRSFDLSKVQGSDVEK